MGLIFRLFRMLATGNLRGLFTVLLGLALVGGLWETALVNLSSRPTATAIMTEVGVEIINPALIGHSFGLSQSVYSSLQATAKAHPNQPLAIPGINQNKVQLLGSDIAGKSFDDGTRAVYAKVAAAYYDDGPAGVFNVPAQITQAISLLSLLPQFAASQGAKAVGAPQLPQVPLPSLAAIGLSPQLFTAQGHTQVSSLQRWFLGAAALLALLVALLSPRWRRLSNVSWSLISAAIPGALMLGVIWGFWKYNPAPFQPFTGLLNLLGRVFVPVYGGAAAVGVAGLLVAATGDMILRSLGNRRTAAAWNARAPAAGGAARAPAAGGAGRAATPRAQPEYRRPPMPGPAYASPDPAPTGPRAFPPTPGPASPYPPSARPAMGQQARGGAPWPPSAGDAQWPPSPSWDAPDLGMAPPQGVPPYGQPGLGQSANAEAPWPGQGAGTAQPPDPFGGQYGGQRNPPWPPRDDDDPWAPRRGR
jgi:hypothetical protein